MMRSALLVALVVALTAAQSTIRTPGDDVVYLIDFHNNGRPRYVDETGDNKVEKGKSPTSGLILINNPLKNSQARADGIYFRPASGQPLDTSLEPVSKNCFILTRFRFQKYFYPFYFPL